MKSIMIVNSSVVANGSDSGSGIGSGDGAEETSMGVLLISNSHVIATGLGNGYGCGMGTGHMGYWEYYCGEGLNTIDMVMILNSTVIASTSSSCGIGVFTGPLLILSSDVEVTSSADSPGIAVGSQGTDDGPDIPESELDIGADSQRFKVFDGFVSEENALSGDG
jgi:hypothetical protein